MEKVYSVTEVAESEGVDPTLVRKHCSDGRIEANQVGRTWVISAKGYRQFKDRNRKVGQPRKKKKEAK